MLRHAGEKGGEKRGDDGVKHLRGECAVWNGLVQEMSGEDGEDGTTGNLSMQGDDAMRRGYCWVVHWKRKQ